MKAFLQEFQVIIEEEDNIAEYMAVVHGSRIAISTQEIFLKIS